MMKGEDYKTERQSGRDGNTQGGYTSSPENLVGAVMILTEMTASAERTIVEKIESGQAV